MKFPLPGDFHAVNIRQKQTGAIHPGELNRTVKVLLSAIERGRAEASQRSG